MSYQAQAVLAIALCAAVIAVICSVKSRLLLPVKDRGGVSVFSVVVISGEAEGLEGTVNGLIRLRDTGRAYTNVIIASDGAANEAVRRAERLALKAGGAVCEKDDISAVIEEIHRERISDTK